VTGPVPLEAIRVLLITSFNKYRTRLYLLKMLDHMKFSFLTTIFPKTTTSPFTGKKITFGNSHCWPKVNVLSETKKPRVIKK